MTITLFCPSRGRPKEAAALRESFIATKATDAELVFCVDSDDRTRSEYPMVAPAAVQVFAPTGDPTGPLNQAALASSAPIIGFIGDDSRFETPGWDVRVERALEKPGLCWPMDGTAKNPWPSTIFVSRDIVRRLGWLSLPALRRGFFDVVWVELAKQTGTARMLGDVMVRHDNSPGDPSSPNYIPERRVPPDVIAADERAYWAWRNGPSFADDCRKVKLASDLARFF